jgi:tRNA pseudouridine38-40 synthase
VIYDIAVKEAHARFAFKRTYEYHINTFKDPFLQEQNFHQN